MLDRPIWTPMARLTYAAYLVHPIIMTPLYGAARVYHVYSEYELGSQFAANAALAYSAAFAIWYREFLRLIAGQFSVDAYLMPRFTYRLQADGGKTDDELGEVRHASSGSQRRPRLTKSGTHCWRRMSGRRSRRARGETGALLLA